MCFRPKAPTGLVQFRYANQPSVLLVATNPTDHCVLTADMIPGAALRLPRADMYRPFRAGLMPLNADRTGF